MKKIVMAVLLSAFVVAPAVAADAGGVYAGIKMGPSDVAGSTFGFGVYGGYDVGPKITSNDFMSKVSFAGEGEYTDFGSNTSNNFGGATYKASAIGAVVAATYPIDAQFSVIVKAGLAITNYDVSCSGCSGLSHNTFGLRHGAAGQYNLSRQVGLRAGLDFYPDGYSMISAGAVIKF